MCFPNIREHFFNWKQDLLDFIPSVIVACSFSSSSSRCSVTIRSSSSTSESSTVWHFRRSFCASGDHCLFLSCTSFDVLPNFFFIFFVSFPISHLILFYLFLKSFPTFEIGTNFLVMIEIFCFTVVSFFFKVLPNNVNT